MAQYLHDRLYTKRVQLTRNAKRKLNYVDLRALLYELIERSCYTSAGHSSLRARLLCGNVDAS